MLGSEIHIDMFDDRLEIASPGGMFGGGTIQEYDVYNIRSMRRNPVIADLFHRMKYMERRGSGLKKIISETEMLPGYKAEFKPKFSSTAMNFKVTFKNLNYAPNLNDLVSDQVSDQVSNQVSPKDITQSILEFCVIEKSKQEICSFVGYKNLTYFTRKYLKPLILNGQLKMTVPNKPNSKNQRYITTSNK